MSDTPARPIPPDDRQRSAVARPAADPCAVRPSDPAGRCGPIDPRVLPGGGPPRLLRAFAPACRTERLTDA